ncbi:hypothetical protein WM16_29760 [Burkholderia ubonensis]|uniref:Uncharacterized protein n=1 Tax=Burkholderia ubonensis TaxID=101571 RepID=A0A119V0S5_9BURK|nr:hypothetical protein WM16_29760 [Burkholderia ubonensis]
MNVTLRCVLTSELVIVTSMALRVPLLALSLIVVFFVTQVNVVVTRMIGTLFIIGSTVAVASALFFFRVYLMMRVARIGVVAATASCTGSRTSSSASAFAAMTVRSIICCRRRRNCPANRT